MLLTEIHIVEGLFFPELVTRLTDGIGRKCVGCEHRGTHDRKRECTRFGPPASDVALDYF